MSVSSPLVPPAPGPPLSSAEAAVVEALPPLGSSASASGTPRGLVAWLRAAEAGRLTPLTLSAALSAGRLGGGAAGAPVRVEVCRRMVLAEAARLEDLRRRGRLGVRDLLERDWPSRGYLPRLPRGVALPDVFGVHDPHTGRWTEWAAPDRAAARAYWLYVFGPQLGAEMWSACGRLPYDLAPGSWAWCAVCGRRVREEDLECGAAAAAIEAGGFGSGPLGCYECRWDADLPEPRARTWLAGAPAAIAAASAVAASFSQVGQASAVVPFRSPADS